MLNWVSKTHETDNIRHDIHSLISKSCKWSKNLIKKVIFSKIKLKFNGLEEIIECGKNTRILNQNVYLQEFLTRTIKILEQIKPFEM